MVHARVRRLVLLLTTAIVFITGFSLMAPQAMIAFADPDNVAEAEAELNAIREKAAEIDAAYSESSEKLREAQETFNRVQADLEKQRQVVAATRVTVAQIARSNYQTAGMGTAASFLTSSDDNSFISLMATRQSVNARVNSQLHDFQIEQARLISLENESARAVTAMTTETQRQAELAKEYDAKEKQAEQVLNRLTIQEQERLRLREARNADRRAEQIKRREAANSRDREEKVAPPNDRAGVIVDFVYAQIGKSYRMGATGMSSFDCSGLAQRAYRTAGISIPRTSQAQFRSGTPVSSENLQPGDLVFYYRGITHVGVYVGNGKVVHASNPRNGIKVSPVFAMPYQGARRYG